MKKNANNRFALARLLFFCVWAMYVLAGAFTKGGGFRWLCFGVLVYIVAIETGAIFRQFEGRRERHEPELAN